jgi:two-component system chemotaxis sensor kinase CheA
VVPLDMVLECMELSAEERTAIRSRSFINLRDQVLPLLRLRDVFEVPGEAGRRENIVVVQYAGRQAGLVVDALQGEFQTVIKPLGRLFENLAGISGSTILGNGEVALILDVPALVQRTVRKEGCAPAAAGASTATRA